VGQTPEPTTGIGTSPPGILLEETTAPSDSPSQSTIA
jgi:hypothetical protein